MYRTPAGAHSLSSKLFSRVGNGANGARLMPVTLYPHYPKEKHPIRFEFKESQFGRALEIHPLYILDEQGSLQKVADRAWQVCDKNSLSNGYAWQCDEGAVSWSVDAHLEVVALLERAWASNGVGNWFELYNVDGVSHQVHPEFAHVVRLFNNAKPWEEGFGVLKCSDFLVPTGQKPVAFRVYYLMVLQKALNPKERKTKLKFVGAEDPAITPMIAKAVLVPALAA